MENNGQMFLEMSSLGQNCNNLGGGISSLTHKLEIVKKNEKS
jgi:hypothetical protein